MKNIKQTLVRNTVANFLGFAVMFTVNIVLVPFIVRSLGIEVYGGIWVVIGALTAYMGLLDLGTGTAFVKFISEYYSKGDKRSLDEVINTGMAFYLAVGGVLMILACLFGEWCLWLIGVPASLMPDAMFVLRVGVLVFTAANVGAPLASMLNGLQRMEINAGVTIAVQLVNIGTTIGVLSAGFGVRGLILNNLFIVLLSTSLAGWFGVRLAGGVHIHPSLCTRDMLKRFFGYGMNLQVSKLAQVLLFQTDRVLSLKMFGMSTAAFYDIGARLCSGGRTVALMTISAVVPAASHLDALEKKEQLLLLYRRGSTYISIAATLLFVFIGLFSPDIILAWMGEGYLASVAIVSVLATGYFFNVISGVASSVAAGVGRTEFERRYGLFTGIFNLVATISLAFLLGPLGIAYGTSLSLFVGAVYMLYQVHRFLGKPAGVLWKCYALPILLGIGPGVACMLARRAVLPVFTDRPHAFAVLCAMLAVFGVAYAGLLAMFRILGRSDLQMVLQIVYEEKS